MLTFFHPMMTDTTHRKQKQVARTAHRSTAVNRRDGKRAHITTTRPRVHHHAAELDIDQLYLSEMARSNTLTAEAEAELAGRIFEAERSLLAAIVRAPSGRVAIAKMRTQIEDGSLDIRDALLNPDQAGLNLEEVKTRILEALESADDDGVVSALNESRLAPETVDQLICAVKVATSAADREQATRIVKAGRDLERYKQRLVVANLRLVVLFARKFRHRGVALLDLVQEGNLGLMRAAEKFDHRRGFRFSTYAAWWIKQALQRSLLDRPVRLPVHVADDRRRISRVRSVFMTQQEREPTAEELSKLTGLGEERIETILALPPQPSSLDQPMGEEGDTTLGDFVSSDSAGPDETVARHALGGQLTELIHTLNPREQEVLRLRFGVGEGDKHREHTLEEVGRVLQLTRERIRQIERAALDKLRAKSERADLASYLSR